MRTPISYYGGKTKMLNKIYPMMPKHRIYVEPYFGGGALFFYKQKSFLEVINDVNGNVINFYIMMKSEFDELNNLIDLTLYDESTFKKAQQIVYNPHGSSNLERAWAFWFVTNFSFANKIGGGIKFDNGTSGTHSGRMFNTRKNEFSFYQKRLEEVQIQNRDAINVISSRNTPETFLFLDPPYPNADQGHYSKEGFDTTKLIELLQFLETEYKGKFMLCNYRQDCFDEYIKRNNWVYHQYDMRLSATKTTNRRKVEIIIKNYTINPTLDLNN